ncbi:hypothetical protein [Pseudomonas taiwanensis]|uniref:Uncharacterized protein n=1 Tax=Pseudomonas taiwanensis TaxID=470150 RepID=A0ABR6V724_9PSED|nr:hypothetical protein [Pseudomonas taiwanensis]MBC3476306.1 hypothetical protein [Pseudomonas taiwanensis]
MNRATPRMTILSKAMIFIAAAVVLCNYYYLYFINFSEGDSEGGSLYSLLKVAGVVLACATLLRPSINRKYLAENIFLLLLIMVATVIFILKSVALGMSDLMFLNTAICFIPFFLLRERENNNCVIFFFESCLTIMAFQIALDTYIFISGLSIWENKAFIGGLGNPSSFGLVCNILIAYILFHRKPKATSVLYFAFLSCGVIMTSSMLSALSLGIILFAWCLLTLSIKKIAYIIISIIAIPIIVSSLASDHLLYKITSATNLLSESPTSDSSRSVSLRVEIHKTYANNFEKDPVEGIFYGFTNSAYIKYDSQVLTYLSSFGMIFTALFFSVISFTMAKSFMARNYFSAMLLFLFSITFATNRILDYYPLPLFFAITFLTTRHYSKRDVANTV